MRSREEVERDIDYVLEQLNPVKWNDRHYPDEDRSNDQAVHDLLISLRDQLWDLRVELRDIKNAEQEKNEERKFGNAKWGIKKGVEDEK